MIAFKGNKPHLFCGCPPLLSSSGGLRFLCAGMSLPSRSCEWQGPVASTASSRRLERGDCFMCSERVWRFELEGCSTSPMTLEQEETFGTGRFCEKVSLFLRLSSILAAAYLHNLCVYKFMVPISCDRISYEVRFLTLRSALTRRVYCGLVFCAAQPPNNTFFPSKIMRLTSNRGRWLHVAFDMKEKWNDCVVREIDMFEHY